MNRSYGFIPARYESSRFPGKPLTPIFGKPMFWHVYMRATSCPDIREVYVATDDARIADKAQQYDIPCIMTDAHHPSGSDRILEAANSLNLMRDSVLVNIQGDEPALEPTMLSQLISPFKDSKVQVSTLVQPIEADEALNPDRVKVVWSKKSGKALYFSRSQIPFQSDTDRPAYWGHIGLYAYTLEALTTFTQTSQSPLESSEKLEQLRFLEADIPIHVVQTEYKSLGVDRPEDIPLVEKLMQENVHESTSRS